jgi:hypothetical protein
MLCVTFCCGAFGQPTNTNSPNTTIPNTNSSFILNTNTDQGTLGKTDANRMPQISVGPFIIQAGQDAKKAESEGFWISVVKTAVWPGFLAIVVVFTVVFFKREISTFWGKIRSIKAKDYGLEIGGEEKLSEQQKVTSSVPSLSATTVPPLSATSTEVPKADFEKSKAAVNITPSLQPMIATLRENVGKSGFTTEQKIELGILALAKSAQVSDFWRIYNFIFGSQLRLLTVINSRPVPQAEVDTYFANLKEKHCGIYETSNPKEYMQFLLNTELVAQDGGAFIIAPKGRDFLVWCVENNLGLDKPM